MRNIDSMIHPRGKFFLRLVSLVLILLIASLMNVLAEGGAANVNTDSRVYQSPSLSSRYAALPKGMQVNVIAVRDGWAMIENNGIVGFTNAAHLTMASSEAAVPDAMLQSAKPAVITSNARIYRSPSTSSASISISKGMRVNLVAVNGSWAMVENAGIVAYMDASRVSLLSDITPDATPTANPLDSAKPAVITSNTRIYRSPSTSSASISVSKGMRVNLVAVNGSWAMVENAGIVAYMDASRVSLLSDITPEPDYSALLANAKDAVLNADTLIFQSADTSSSFMGVPKGTRVRLLAVNGDWALIERDGAYGFTNAACVTVETAPTATPEPAQPDYSSLLPNAKAAVISADTKVYKFADSSSTSASIAKGTSVRLLAVNGDWALIERDGAYGFVSAGCVAEAVQPTPTPKPTVDPGDYFASTKYSNEQKCYFFLTREMGLNTAAASGILANIYKECSFNPTCGGSYYGLCQWGGGRLTNLKSFCSKNGYSYSSLEGQLRFLAHELKNSYPAVLTMLQETPNTAQGAYDAGYRFCYDYERPAARESSSVTRGNLARDTYYSRYA